MIPTEYQESNERVRLSSKDKQEDQHRYDDDDEDDMLLNMATITVSLATIITTTMM